MNDGSGPVRINDGILRIGGDDRTATIFEGAIPIPEGVSYNSYVIVDEKTCLLDTCDLSVAPKFWDGLISALDGRRLDYLVINHMEPDHGAAITRVLETWPDVTVVGNTKTFDMLRNFYSAEPENRLVVKEGDELSLGKHTLRFYFAVMVHWPEVMFSYEIGTKTLFSADAFGTFKALDGSIFADECDFDREFLSEARRYYANIVGKYGAKVQSAIAKLKDVPIEMICPLHGPIWREDLGKIIGIYNTWSTYAPEERGVAVAYASMYGNTAAVAERLAVLLREKGVRNITVRNVSRDHPTYVVADAFRYSHIVLAAPTYNNALHPTMSSVLEDMENMAVQNRHYAVIGNGSWAPQSARIIDERMSAMKGMTRIGELFVITSSLKQSQMPELEELASAIAKSVLEG